MQTPAQPSRCKLAMVQMRVDGGSKNENLSRAEARIAEAAQAGANVVLLPEALTLGWTHPSAKTEADAIPEGASFQRLSEAARASQVYVCAGLVEKSGDRIFNAAVLIGSSGELLLHYRKINELEIGHEFYDLGDRLGVVKTPFGTFGLMICADAFAKGQMIARTLAAMGAEVILSPASWAVPADYDHVAEPYGNIWRENYGTVARDYQISIAGVSNVGPINAGPWAGRKCIGCSLLVGPDGNEAAMGPYGENAETILYHELKLRARDRSLLNHHP